jgi:ketosteroid isomerase-like protein
VHGCAKVLQAGALGGEQMVLTREAFAAWMDSYGRAWEARDAKAAAELYAENGTYQVTPFVEPMRGRAATLEYWTHVAKRKKTFNLDTKSWH